MIKILTRNGIENTNIDGARFTNLAVGQSSGIVSGSFSSDSPLVLTDNAVTLNPCELIISGHRVVVDAPESVYSYNTPANSQRLSLVAQISVGIDSVPVFSMFLQQSGKALVQENLFMNSSGLGTYQIELGRMIQNTTGKFSDLSVTVNRLTGVSASAEQGSTELKKYVDATFSNVLKGALKGGAIRIDDPSPIEHIMDVKLSTKNLLSYPYVNTTKTSSGITYTDNGDGSIHAKGTATGEAWFMLSTTLDLGSESINAISRDYATNGIYTISKGLFYGASNKQLSLNFPKGAVVDETFYPQVELGTVATAYSPYISDFSGVKLIERGKNLIPYPYYQATSSNGGITYTDNGDGTITANGTTTGNSYILISNQVYFPSGTYFLSGCPKDILRQGLIYISNNDYTVYQADYGDGVSFTLNEGGLYNVFIQVLTGTTLNNAIFKPQLELGSKRTKYESPLPPIEYPVNSDGVVEGVTPIYPTTVLTTDPEGALIECGYNKDLNKAFMELYNAIISLGGNV